MEKQIRELTIQEKKKYSGGWAWFVAAMPWILQIINTIIAAAQTSGSDKGSLKYNAKTNLLDASWDNTESISQQDNQDKIIFYAY